MREKATRGRGTAGRRSGCIHCLPQRRSCRPSSRSMARWRHPKLTGTGPTSPTTFSAPPSDRSTTDAPSTLHACRFANLSHEKAHSVEKCRPQEVRKGEDDTTKTRVHHRQACVRVPTVHIVMKCITGTQGQKRNLQVIEVVVFPPPPLDAQLITGI